MKEYAFNFLLVTVFYLLNIGTIVAQQEKISFVTEEGTWMALDVSPDGETINSNCWEIFIVSRFKGELLNH